MWWYCCNFISLHKSVAKETEENAREVEKNLDLVMAPLAPERQAEMQRAENVTAKRMEVD